MRYLISGQTGFIGQAITKYLLSKEETVIPIPRNKSILSLVKLFTDYPPDYIIHLGAYGNHYYQKDFKKTVTANLLGTYNLLEAAKIFDYIKFYNISSSSVALEKQTYYSMTKFCGEQLVGLYENTVNIRPHSVYGPGEAKHRFIPTVIDSLKTGSSMIVDTEATHDWVYIDDFIESLFEGKTEIGTGVKSTNKEIINMLEKISGKKLTYTFGKMRSYDHNNWVSKRGVPHIDCFEGLKKTYEYFTQ